MSERYDVIVIGAGPAGYPAAIRAGQNKLKVACVDEWRNSDGTHTFGGTCLNAGCIPSKALLESSELYQRAKDEFSVHGIEICDLKLDLAAMQRRRASVVKTMTGGITALFKANGVVGIQGHGRLLPGNNVVVTGADGAERTLEATHVVLASGSVPVRLKNVPHDAKYIVDSWNALEFDAVPARLGVIGAGVIGLELGSVWRRIDSEVTVLEALEQFLPIADGAIANKKCVAGAIDSLASDGFGRSARELSNCPSGERGGELGWLKPDDCASEFARELFGHVEVGVLPRLVHSRFGLHVVEVLEREGGVPQTYEAVRGAVAMALRQQAWVTALRQCLQLLAGQAMVEGIDLDAASTPLVQ